VSEKIHSEARNIGSSGLKEKSEGNGSHQSRLMREFHVVSTGISAPSMQPVIVKYWVFLQ
jgi:hypothetical protein